MDAIIQASLTCRYCIEFIGTTADPIMVGVYDVMNGFVHSKRIPSAYPGFLDFFIDTPETFISRCCTPCCRSTPQLSISRISDAVLRQGRFTSGVVSDFELPFTYLSEERLQILRTDSVPCDSIRTMSIYITCKQIHGSMSNALDIHAATTSMPCMHASKATVLTPP